MRRFICLLVMVGMLVIPASVFGSSYIGLGFFIGNVDYADKRVGMYDDIRPWGPVLRLGTYFTPTTAVEVRYMDLYGEESASDSESGSKTDFDFRAISGLIKANLLKLKEAQVYGLLGYTSIHIKVLGFSNQYVGVTYGCGLDMPFIRNGSTSFSVEYNHVANVELCDVSGFTALFNMKF